MKIHVVPAGQLTQEQIQAWSCLQSSDSRFESPFFRPEYTLAVAAVRPDIKVALIEQEGELVGFFPYQQIKKGIAVPVGWNLCDCDGVVMRQDVAWTVPELLRGCRLRAWHFAHLITAQNTFQPYHWKLAEAPYIDLSQGYEGYERDKRQSKSHTFREVSRKMRKLEREQSPLRLVLHTTDLTVLDRVIEWKRAQFYRIGCVDHLEEDWTRAVLRQCLTYQEPRFSGLLSALYCQDNLLAAHVGLLSGHFFHSWFSVYNVDFAQWSPGILFWLKFTQLAHMAGIRRIDFGKGDEEYKQHLKTGSTLVAEGSVDYRPLAQQLRWCYFQAKERVRHSRLQDPAKKVIHFLRRLRHDWWSRERLPQTALPSLPQPLPSPSVMDSAAKGGA